MPSPATHEDFVTPSGEKTVLVLQGGGALGAYQAGAYEALAEANLTPDWVAGISIGAINGAIIAGNMPDLRVPRLRAFWERVSAGLLGKVFGNPDARSFFNEASAALVSTFGVPGFFSPRFPPALFMPAGTPEAISLYDTTPLHATLSELIDFEVLNSQDNSSTVRFSAGAVQVATGNFEYFDTTYGKHKLGPEHIMASGALPPGFPPVVIGEHAYWDGGLVSNTPLDYVLQRCGAQEDMCVFQVDLFSARGAPPRTLFEVAQREKEIRFSSRTRLNTDAFADLQTLRSAARTLTGKLPKSLRGDPDAKLLAEFGSDAAVTIVHLIHRRAAYERQSMDYEFSRLSMEEHWKAGRDDVQRTLHHKNWRDRVRPDGVAILDLTRGDPDS